MRNIVIKIRLIRLIRRQNQLAGLFQVDSNTQVSKVEMEFFQRYNKALINFPSQIRGGLGALIFPIVDDRLR